MMEQDLQSLIRIRLSELGWTVFRANVGKFKLADGRWFDSGLPRGFSDLFACKGGQVVFIEVKTGNNKPSEEQIKFIDNMRKQGFKAGAVWSFDDVERLIYDGNYKPKLNDETDY